MIREYRTIAIIYGGSGRAYAEETAGRLTAMAVEERYPIRPKIIMERILTGELFADLRELFHGTDLCVAFLTADDLQICAGADGGRSRLRQNVVFELGMALNQIGRDRCILVADFDVHSPEFDLPSDMSSLEVNIYGKGDADRMIGDVVKKVLNSSYDFEKAAPGGNAEKLGKYERLLLREQYYLDYENLFDLSGDTPGEGRPFLARVLKRWSAECRGLPNYDERAVFLLERIGFIPIFGRTEEVEKWLVGIPELVGHYSASDIAYYKGSQLLDFVSSLLDGIIEYTRIKTDQLLSDDFRFNEYSRLAELFSENAPEGPMNPLLELVYYDYLGLVQLRLYNYDRDRMHLDAADAAFNTAMSFTASVDMSLRVWAGFVSFNLARVQQARGDTEKAVKWYKTAITIRRKWLKTSGYNLTIRNALSSEYFIARIGYISLCKNAELFTQEEFEREYRIVEAELNIYSDVDRGMEQLVYVRKLLESSKA